MRVLLEVALQTIRQEPSERKIHEARECSRWVGVGGKKFGGKKNGVGGGHVSTTSAAAASLPSRPLYITGSFAIFTTVHILIASGHS